MSASTPDRGPRRLRIDLDPQPGRPPLDDQPVAQAEGVGEHPGHGRQVDPSLDALLAHRPGPDQLAIRLDLAQAGGQVEATNRPSSVPFGDVPAGGEPFERQFVPSERFSFEPEVEKPGVARKLPGPSLAIDVDRAIKPADRIEVADTGRDWPPFRGDAEPEVGRLSPAVEIPLDFEGSFLLAELEIPG